MFARLILALVSVLPAASALAEIVTYDFSGTVTAQSNSFAIGDQIMGSFSYPLLDPPIDAEEFRAYYPDTPGAQVSVGIESPTGAHASFSGQWTEPQMLVADNPGGPDGFSLAKFGGTSGDMALSFYDPAGLAISGLGAPANLTTASFPHGIFRVENSGNTFFDVDLLTLRQPEAPRVPKTHVLSVAIADVNRDKIGNGIANRIADAFRRLNGVATSTALPLTQDNDSEKNNQQEIYDTINMIRGQMAPGDNFIFHIYTHGGYFDIDGNEPLVIAQKEIFTNPDGSNRYVTAPSTADEYLKIQDTIFSEIGHLTDDEMSVFFNKEEWNDINKLFIIDACYSGGFWNVDPTLGDTGDLAVLQNAALLSSSREFELAHYDPRDPDHASFLGIALERVVNQLSPSQSVDFLSLAPIIRQEAINDLDKVVNFEEMPVYVTGFPEDNWDIPVLLTEIPDIGVLQTTDGFSLHISVPEPSAGLMLVFATLLFCGYHRGHGLSR